MLRIGDSRIKQTQLPDVPMIELLGAAPKA
jgi:hypothetical protein